MTSRVQKFLLIALLAVANDAFAEAEGVAGVFNGIASIFQAVAPIAVAGIQAKADKQIAQIASDAAIKTTEITAETSKDLAVIQKDIAIYQAETARDINKENNDAQTERLGMQLAELRAAREDARESEREKRRIEQQYNDLRIDLAKKQADDQYKLAQMTLKANLVQAGLISGFRTIDSSKGMTTRSLGSGRIQSSSGFASAAIRTDKRALTITGGGSGMRFSGSSGARSASSQRLLSALTGQRSPPGAAGPRQPTSIASLVTGNKISGSTSLTRFRAASRPENDLSSFRRAPVLADSQDYTPRYSEPVSQGGGHSGARGFMGN